MGKGFLVLTQSQASAPTPTSSNRHHHNGSNCPTPILLHPGRGGSSRAAHPHRGGRRKHPVLVGGLPGREPQPVVHRLRHLHSGDPHVHGHRSARSHLLPPPLHEPARQALERVPSLPPGHQDRHVHHRRLLLGRPQASVHALRRHVRLRHHQRPGSRRLRLHPQQGRVPRLLQGRA